MYAITFIPFLSALYSPLPCTHLPPAFPHLSSCPFVINVSFLASPFPVLFLISRCLFCTYHLCFLFPGPFSPFSPICLPTDNPPRDLHFCDSVPILVASLVHFCFVFLGSVVDSCEFVVILLFVFLIILFFLDKSL